jgi:leucyl-tRNA synthetase
MKDYDHKKIEKKWQDYWQKQKLYQAKDNSPKKKYYTLFEFNYPSGDGLHVGHVRTDTAMDVISRKRRMQGFNVLYPVGWDSFGLPTENYAIKTGIHPKVVTKKNTDNFRRQIKSLGISVDWSREIDTSDPNYYKWTQWHFLQFFKHGLAYKQKMLINWCPKDKIGLANEEVIDGKCERCGTPVEKREKEQWMLAITKYADRLDKDLDKVDFEERIKIQQRNWIGRSEGAEIEFGIKNNELGIKVFTTRPDTLFGVTYMVLAPEHELMKKLESKIKNNEEVQKYISDSKNKTEIERTAEGKDTSTGRVQAKTGVELKGVKAINPATKEEIPVYIADYVLSTYGTGAIMAVPAHDERDYAFAKKYNLPIKKVIEPVFSQSVEPGRVVEGLPFDNRDAIIAVVKHWSEEKYIALKWKKVAWGTFITGGIEGNQTAEEAAKMEIREETGYLNPKLIADFGILHGKFYHVPKKVNRFAHARTLLMKLENDERQEVEEKEKEIHEVLWLTKEELRKFLTPDSHLRALEILNGQEVYSGEGQLTHSGKFDGITTAEARVAITKVFGQKKITYKLRDWIFSRQRYWGEPIPMIHCPDCGWVPVPEKELPIKLPDVKNYKPTDTGESPLAKIKSFVETKCPQCKGPAKRETDTMPNWAGSSWYFLRYLDPKNKKKFADPKKLKYWMPVDWYNGGMEHTTLHLLYSRFWHKFLYDLKLVPQSEPYKKRTSHGLILAGGGEKMSKSKGNVVNPDDIVTQFGADTLRVYEMFIGPFGQAVAWSTDGIVGPRRFLERIWKLQEKVIKKTAENKKLESALHRAIKKVTEDIEVMQFNTAISALMILSNEMEKNSEISSSVYETFLQLLAPFAPHITEELWSELGHKKSIHLEAWPKFDLKKLADEEVTIVVQVNGKVRGEFTGSPSISEQEVKTKAQGLTEVKKWTDGKEVIRVIFVPGKLVNFVIKS